tara:strand:- start:14949 stop:16376 length:1428 start_codon:yes stop_codon:yes gene_type:complete
MKALKLENLFVAIHVLAPITLGTITLNYLNDIYTVPYLALTLVTIALLTLSSGALINQLSSKFLYLFGLLISLGCWFKYSVYTIFPLTKLPEPIGNFILGSPDEGRVLWVATTGISAILMAHLFKVFVYKKLDIHKSTNISKLKPKASIALATLCLMIAAALINLKFNILLFALKPDVQLPLKGNVIFFLLLTRGLPFLFIYFCLRKFSLLYISIGALVFTISSIGVLSRMGIFIYFLVVSLLVVHELSKWNALTAIKKVAALGIIFLISTYLTVSFSTGAREYFFKQNQVPSQDKKTANEVSVDAIIQSSSKTDNFRILKELALGRWIGIEGIMAVDAYSGKGLPLLIDALLEKSYSGNSFYSSISSVNLPSKYNENVFTTSVPGPIAFFYYTGNLAVIFIAIFFASLFYVLLEHILFLIFSNLTAPISFLITVLTLDFYQFGISPIAFMKYLGFTIFSILAFYFMQRKSPFLQ